jgi:hypothetical protein
MGTVYEAEEPGSGRHVALKIIRPEFADSPDAVERFRREGRLASTLSHPRCVFVLAADEEDGIPYIVMELMTGSTLADLVSRRGPLPTEEAVRYILDAAEGLEEAHHAGVIHRDIKPSNCFLDAEGRVKVGDFGLAKSLIGQEQLTRSGAFLGTFLFASPEQIRNDRVDHRTDVYSLCATLYFLLTGRAPFDDADPAAALARTVSDPLRPMRSINPSLPRTLDEVVMKGLARDRSRRWSSLRELRLALLPFVEGPHSLGELAARSAAYLLDVLLMTLPLGLLVHPWVSPMLEATLPAAAVPLGHLGLTLLLYLGTFAVAESVLGWTPGKWLLGLRVRESASGDRPSPWRSVLRTTLFVLFTNGMVELAYSLVRLLAPELPTAGEGMTAKLLLGHVGVALLPLVSMAAGACLVACTMRRGTGYRGLHEWLSGTHVIQLPDAQPRFVLPSRHEWPTLAEDSQGLPGRIGGFRVLGTAWRSEDEAVLYAADATLDRPAWLWLRKGVCLTPHRRGLNRPGRARWLAGGERGEDVWEAFLAAPGCLLLDLASQRKLRWPEALQALEQLCSELAAAEADGTLPETLSLEQVWTQADGRTVLLDAPARPPSPVESPMELLRQVAAVALEGGPRPRGRMEGPIQAPIPGHAAELLLRLMSGGYASPARLAEALAAARDRPAEISRASRAMHLMFTAILLAPGLLTMFLLGPLLLGLALGVCAAGRAQAEARMEEDAPALAAALVTRPSGVALLGTLGIIIEDLKPHVADLEKLESLARQRAAVMESYSWYMRSGMDRLEREARAKGVFRMPEPESVPADPLMSDTDDLTMGPAPLAWGLLEHGWWLGAVVLFWPIAWALAAAVLGGGVVARLGGIRLLDAEGRRAALWRTHLRTLVVWLPVAGLLGLSLVVDLMRVARSPEAATQPILAWVAWGAWWLALGLLLTYAWAAVRWPGRGLHDRIAGTYPVPR